MLGVEYVPVVVVQAGEVAGIVDVNVAAVIVDDSVMGTVTGVLFTSTSMYIVPLGSVASMSYDDAAE